MPDIAMCTSTTCPMRATCKRHEASGVVPDNLYQWWFNGAQDKDGKCEWYLTEEEKEDG